MLTLSEMRETTGMVLPVWYPEHLPTAEMERVLEPCLVDIGPFARPENVIVVVDGSKHARKAVENVRARRGGFEILFQEQNTGKGGAVASGIRQLLQRGDVKYVVARDHDNDHLVNDALNLVNLVARMQRETGHEIAVGIGRRASVHRHLGFVRGEYEWMINEVAFEATKFALAREGRTVNTQYFAAYELVPDMQTGFKCYTRAAAQRLVDALDRGESELGGLDIRRNGAEVPVIVETLLRGGTIGEVMRLAWENQPLTTYDLAGRVQVKGTVLTWVLHRTNVPGPVARQLLMNAVARRTMSKEEKGLADLLALSNWVLDKLSGLRQEGIEPIRQLTHPEFF